MPAAAARPSKAEAKALAHRRGLCEELVGLHRDNSSVFDRIEAIKAELKLIATDAGEPFREVIAGKGQVSVSPPKDGEFKGNVPTLKAEAWNDLTDARRERLLEQGLVEIVAEYGGKFYGRVDVKTF
jgi:hypothetical protein